MGLLPSCELRNYVSILPSAFTGVYSVHVHTHTHGLGGLQEKEQTTKTIQGQWRTRVTFTLPQKENKYQKSPPCNYSIQVHLHQGDTMYENGLPHSFLFGFSCRCCCCCFINTRFHGTSRKRQMRRKKGEREGQTDRWTDGGRQRRKKSNEHFNAMEELKVYCSRRSPKACCQLVRMLWEG